uniref:SCP domain-containing protein n=1 Tax=Haemonchus contortus TaxID=6289 RepID=A0A7I4Y091_HAECO|nr:unnamed protein product [Haemonchus contortus]
MHSLIVSITCYVFLFIGGYAKNRDDFQWEENVPLIAQEALLSIVNEEKTKMSGFKSIRYDDELAKNAYMGEAEGHLKVLEGQSDFKNSWNETLREVLEKNRGKTYAAEKIGCEFTLATSPVDGSHNLKLDCRLGN